MKKIVTVGLCVVLLTLVFSGCIEDTEEYTNPLTKDVGYTTYSDDESTALVYVSSMAKGNTSVIVNQIDKMYDAGFKYVCIVPIPDNRAGMNAYYLVFRKGI
jgi:anionic cell wall polymer biosynthesis LytR-Cps2A-Psr (LCP) family protein